MSWYDVKDLTNDQCNYIRNNAEVGSALWWEVSNKLASDQLSREYDRKHEVKTPLSLRRNK